MEALCQSVAGLQENMSVKVVTPLEEDAAQKDDVTGILNETDKPSISVSFCQIYSLQSMTIFLV